MPNFVRYCLIANLLGVFAWFSLNAQETAPLPTYPVAGWVELGFGLDSETGRPLTIEPQLGLGARYGPVYAGLDYAASGERLFDRLGIKLGLAGELTWWLALRGEGIVVWRSYGQAGDEMRVGVLIHADFGAQPARMGLALRTLAGFSILNTSIQSLGVSWIDNDPLLGLGIVWFSGTGWEISTMLTDYNPDDASLWLKTFFVFSAGYRCPAWALRADLVLKYSDLFTLTGYLDGAAVRLFFDLPLTGVLP